MLGKAAYSVWAARAEAMAAPAFEQMPEEARAYFMEVGEVVAKELATLLAPVIRVIVTDEELVAFAQEGRDGCHAEGAAQTDG